VVVSGALRGALRFLRFTRGAEPSKFRSGERDAPLLTRLTLGAMLCTFHFRECERGTALTLEAFNQRRVEAQESAAPDARQDIVVMPLADRADGYSEAVREVERGECGRDSDGGHDTTPPPENARAPGIVGRSPAPLVHSHAALAFARWYSLRSWIPTRPRGLSRLARLPWCRVRYYLHAASFPLLRRTRLCSATELRCSASVRSARSRRHVAFRLSSDEASRRRSPAAPQADPRRGARDNRKPKPDPSTALVDRRLPLVCSSVRYRSETG